MLAQMVVEGKVAIDEPVRELCRRDWSPSPSATKSRWSIWPRNTPVCRAMVAGDWHEYLVAARSGPACRTRRFVYSNFGFGLLGQAAGSARRHHVFRSCCESRSPARSAWPIRWSRYRRAAGPVHPGVQRERTTGPLGPEGLARSRRDSLHRRRHAQISGSQPAPGNARRHVACGDGHVAPAARRRRRPASPIAWRGFTARRTAPGRTAAPCRVHQLRVLLSRRRLCRGGPVEQRARCRQPWPICWATTSGSAWRASRRSPWMTVFVPASRGFPACCAGSRPTGSPCWPPACSSIAACWACRAGRATAAAPCVPARLGLLQIGGILPVCVRVLSAAGVRRIDGPHRAARFAACCSGCRPIGSWACSSS